MSTNAGLLGTLIPAIWHPQSFSDLHERLKSDPRGVSADLDTTLQFLALRTQSSSTDITNIYNIVSGKGTVSSVALAMPSIFSVSGSPITDTGTLTVALVTETANFVWAGPPSGAAALPTFRALVAGDLPLATSSAVGAVKPDNVTVTVTAGVLSSTTIPTVHDEPLTDGASNFIFASGDVVVVVGVPN